MHRTKNNFSCFLDPLQTRARALVSRQIFSNFFLGCIILNTVVLAMEFDGMPKKMEFALFVANIVLTVLFTVELILKLIGLGWREYSADGFNIFDAVVVIFALIELSFLAVGGTNEYSFIQPDLTFLDF